MAQDWKTDPLYRLIFREVAALWDGLNADPRATHRPEAFRVEEYAEVAAGPPAGGGPPRRVWAFDDHGPRLFPILAGEAHDRGVLRGDCWQFGLIRFAINGPRDRVVLIRDLGPYLAGEDRFDVGEGETLHHVDPSTRER